MSESENKVPESQDVTEKEKESSKDEEKDKDTAQKLGTPRQETPKRSPAGSRKSSGKSGTGQPGSGKGGRATPAKSSPAPKQAPKGKGKGKEEPKPPETPAAGNEDDGKPPEGCIPIFLSSKTQEIFHCRGDVDVTQENQMKIITKQEILDDLHNRAGVSDFHPFKQQIINYPSDELLLMYDFDFRFGQNFYIALTEEAKEKILNPPKEEGEEEGQDMVEEEQVVYKYIPPESKDWVSHGSEKEITEESVIETRRKIKVSVRRKRREFGAPFEFKDRNVSDAKDGYVECVSYEDRTFDLKKIELNKGIQAIPVFVNSGTQTDWKYPRSSNVQYESREFSTEEREKIENSKNLANFISNVTPRLLSTWSRLEGTECDVVMSLHGRPFCENSKSIVKKEHQFELALQQNEIMDVFHIDWVHLGDSSDAFGSKADNHLKEYQSFTDLQFSKEKKITCIQWHPTIKGVVAVSVAEKMNFDERIDEAAKVIMTPSLILIWNFTDPIHPQLLLEAPDDIYSFQFSPSDANIIAGGCQNGQLVLWDISAHAERLKQPRGGSRNKRTLVLPGFEDPNALKTPIVRYCAVSNIENSHHAPITDLLWLPDHLEVNRMGVPQENKSLQCCQIMTCAADYCILFWDTRPPKGPQQQQSSKNAEKEPVNPMGVPITFKHLDLTWKPMLKVHLHKSEPGGDHMPTKFSIAEKQGDRGALSKAADGNITDKEASIQGGHFIGKPGSGKDKRTLQGVKTHFYVGTEDGEVVYVDWMPQKDQDTGKIQTPKPDFYHAIHDGPVSTVQRSPFFSDILLVVGGWTFTIWKEGVSSGPILQSCANSIRFTVGHWSPSRPGVFYLAKMDGSVDVWDLLDKTHEPSLTQSVSPTSITTIFPWPISHKQHLLAVGDSAGTLHILEIPWSLKHSTPNELTGVANYFEREVKRRVFVVARWDFRELEKRELEAEQKKKAGIAPQVLLSEEEIEYRMKQEYNQYLETEAAFLRELGLKDDEEPLPAT